MNVRCTTDQLEEWIDFVLAHPTIEELVIDHSGSVGDYLDLTGKLHQKLNKMRQYVKFTTLRTIYVDYRTKIKEHLEHQKWFDRISFLTHSDSEFQDILEFGKMSQLKNYKIKQHFLMLDKCVVFEKYEE